jgi:ABC-type multidrug transport system fused ATPase/permease subunit
MRNIFKHIILVCVLTVITIAVNAGTVMFEEANKLYHNKQYQQSTELYMQIINDGYHSCSVFYNAGNAFFKGKQFGMAVWCYQKALQYEPENNIIIENLALTNSKINIGKKKNAEWIGIRWIKNILHFHTLNKWCLGALIFYLLFMGIRISRLLFKQPAFFIGMRKLFFWCFIIYSLAAVSNYIFQRLYKHAVVIKNTQFYKDCKTDKASKTQQLQGTVVRILSFDKQDLLSAGRYKVLLPNNKFTWLDAEAVKML